VTAALGILGVTVILWALLFAIAHAVGRMADHYPAADQADTTNEGEN